jgi:hypothetical protein
MWSVTWVSQLLAYWKTQTKELRDNSKTIEENLNKEVEAFKAHLDEKMRFRIEAFEKEVREQNERYERLRLEKEEVLDTLRHKQKELEMMNKAVEFDEFTSIIKELQVNLTL